jgi:hypothetical protein
MDSYSKNYGDSKPPKKRSTIYSKPFKCPVVTLKKHPGDTIPSPGNSNTIPQDSNQKLQKGLSHAPSFDARKTRDVRNQRTHHQNPLKPH